MSRVVILKPPPPSKAKFNFKRDILSPFSSKIGYAALNFIRQSRIKARLTGHPPSPIPSSTRESEQLLRSKILNPLISKYPSEPVRQNDSRNSLGSESKVMRIILVGLEYQTESPLGAFVGAGGGLVGLGKLGAVAVIEKAKIEKHL
ncbi:hypothetical protein PPACK8108_LOCUS19009 [Phakopsora pachyrhizi]|uniref:Uncharacterized protein n=1 Tax=Phakopsora pachyrhizi TaxID=170000 RepID=A0AAV0BCU9_PHAPC|nr:hypothetical protein PPACK8108_LOCUS19009 [Phakopsora pachyrhizi]